MPLRPDMSPATVRSVEIPSTAELLERLRRVLREEGQPRLTDEALAGELPITLSTVSRWKKRPPRDYRHLMECLALAGWLNEQAILDFRRLRERELHEGVETAHEDVRDLEGHHGEGAGASDG